MRSIKTFVVEDSPVIREQLTKLLQDVTSLDVVGYAETEAGALEALQGQQSDVEVVLVDIILREGTGLGLLRQAALPRDGKTYVVLSNYTTPEMTAEALRLGAHRVFNKSTELDALVDFCDELAAA